MDVFNEIMIVGKDRGQRERILTEAFQILRDIAEKTDRRSETSDIARVNRQGFEEPQKVSDETYEMIQESLEFFKKSEAAFDITLLPLMELWGFYGGEPHLPLSDPIQAVLGRVNSNQLVLNKKKKKVGFRIPEMGIDLNGIIKGYACDRVTEFLKSEGVENALVNIGGTIRAFGLAPDRKPWRVGIRHPRDPTRTFKVVTLVNEALATGGDYEQFFVVKGRRYSHILDPRTGYPPDRSVAVTVIAPSALLADVLSRSLFVLGPEQAPLLANQFKEIRWYLVYLANGDHFKTLSSEPAF